VLNEAVVGRGEVVRPVRLIAEIDGRHLTTYVADAVIIATPTGSTAYALAAGGPILPPELRNILLVPVAPHLSVDRAIVLHEGSWVRVVVETDHEASLSIDGQAPIPMEDQDQISAHASEHRVHFVRLQEPDYFYRNLTSRMNQNRTRQLLRTGARTIAVGCPFCMIMIEDGVKTAAEDRPVEVLDVAEVLEQATQPQ